MKTMPIANRAQIATIKRAIDSAGGVEAFSRKTEVPQALVYRFLRNPNKSWQIAKLNAVEMAAKRILNGDAGHQGEPGPSIVSTHSNGDSAQPISVIAAIAFELVKVRRSDWNETCNAAQLLAELDLKRSAS